MALPTGSGSERLKRATAHNVTGWTDNLLSGTALHIYTIISIIFSSQTGSSGAVGMKMNDGTDDISIMTYDNNIVGSYQTWVWNDRFVLEEDDDLDVYNAVAGDWLVTYIDQDWT